VARRFAGDRSMIIRRLMIIATCLTICGAVDVLLPVNAHAATPCTITATGRHGILTNGLCLPGRSISSEGETAASIKTEICGQASDGGGWKSACGPPYECWNVDPNKGRVLQSAFATFLRVGGVWVLQNVWCPNDAQPALTMAAVRQQVLRLLPKVAVGIAWKTTALVNAETVVWPATEAERSLGTVTVVGRQVGLRIAFDHANWDFGDGVTDTTSSPGKAYTDSDPCHTAQCADYYGHTYTDTGERTITLTVAWHAEFSLDGGRTWAAVDQAPLTGPQATHTLTVEQARGILVNNP
jgi:hypothetical protein